jgi:hypothetical protein
MDEYEIQYIERNANENNHNRRPQHRAVLVPRSSTHQPHVVYAQSGAGVGAGLGAGCGLLGRMNTGQVIDMVAQIFVALMPLPAAPVPTSDPTTDVPNMILYQSSLAQYAKRDEQVRVLGSLIVKLVG